MTRRTLVLFTLVALSVAPPALAGSRSDAPPRLATIAIPGDKRLVRIARDLIEAKIAMNPDLAASIGLFDDAVVVPSYTPQAVAKQDARFAKDLAALDKLPWRTWDVDQQIDARWLQANAEDARHKLTVERLWTHRYGEYLEPVAGAFISLTTYAPDRVDLRVRLAALIPDMLVEMQQQVTSPTRRDLTTGIGLMDGIVVAIQQLPDGPERTAATDALIASRTALAARDLTLLPEFTVIGAESYSWKFEHLLLLPWTPAQLLIRAGEELQEVDAQLETLSFDEPLFAGEAESTRAGLLDKAGFLGLYDDVVARNLAALRSMDVMTVPDAMPAMRARETPAALVPLTGDGGSMNPPLAFGPRTEGWWNVEHFNPDWTQEQRATLVMNAAHDDVSGLGPYAVHEGVPGHHLQLSLLRGMDPIRAILQDGCAVEGWALYAEQLFWEGGGFGTTDTARARMLRSYKGRIRRVYYDVNIETGAWSLQEAADWKMQPQDGHAEPDTDVLRSINWPTQLITYFAGKTEILDLREEVRRRQGDAYSERAFNDALLAEGPIPIVLIRAKMLGEPVPE